MKDMHAYIQQRLMSVPTPKAIPEVRVELSTCLNPKPWSGKEWTYVPYIFNLDNRLRLQPLYHWWKTASGNHCRGVWERPSDDLGVVTRKIPAPLGIEPWSSRPVESHCAEHIKIVNGSNMRSKWIYKNKFLIATASVILICTSSFQKDSVNGSAMRNTNIIKFWIVVYIVTRILVGEEWECHFLVTPHTSRAIKVWGVPEQWYSVYCHSTVNDNAKFIKFHHCPDMFPHTFTTSSSGAHIW
jgi:hypothetical protein